MLILQQAETGGERVVVYGCGIVCVCVGEGGVHSLSLSASSLSLH